MAESDQTNADTDQTIGDLDQTSADSDQTSADTDQTSSDIDQVAADRDQAASDRDLAAGVDPYEREITRDMRHGSTAQREQAARARLDTASRRDAAADARDLIALARDQAAAARDLAMAELDLAEQQGGGRGDFGIEIILRATEHRRRAADFRAHAAEHRRLAAEDRHAAAREREQAAEERLRALADREISAVALAIAETDLLTGARTRAAGLRDLDREVERCRRTATGLVIVYADVVGLKALNDALGHSAGDELLVRIAAVFRANLRPYDLIVRVGGDEFLCAMPNLTEADARLRFERVADELAAAPQPGGIRTGFALLRADDTTAELIARADGGLFRNLDARPEVGATPVVHPPGELGRAECLRRLATNNFGRLVTSMPSGRPLIRPVNYRFDPGSQSVVFRTDEGSKLFALQHAQEATFEIDGIDPTANTGWSVIVTGLSEEIVNPAELQRLAAIGVEHWAPGDRNHWIRVRAYTITGRQLDLPG